MGLGVHGIGVVVYLYIQGVPEAKKKIDAYTFIRAGARVDIYTSKCVRVYTSSIYTNHFVYEVDGGGDELI